MAAKTPVTDPGTAGYVIPQRTVYGGENTGTQNFISDVNEVTYTENKKLSIFYFSDVDTADTWASGLPGVTACAWQGADPTDDAGGVCLITRSTGTIGLLMENANSEGWLWVLHD